VISEGGSVFRVFKGVLINDQDKPNMDIVIKTLSENANAMQKDTFYKETSLLCPLQHMNILGLLGISPGEGTEFVVFEYLSEVDLHQFLEKAQTTGTNASSDILLNIARQIANGMKYLSEFSYVHGDLAARNCFISDEGGELTVKISLLGIGSHKYPSDYDLLHEEKKLFPVRWMSPEALDSGLLTKENDVWSFGVLLWEIFSLGLKPYHQYSNSEVTKKVRALEVLQCPAYWPQSVRDLMDSCWTVAPSSRSNFVIIYDRLNSLFLDDVIQEVRV
jgi:receptor tyrosine kinase-like orphan receptor 1